MMETNAHSKSIQQITNNHQAMLESSPETVVEQEYVN